MSLSVGQNLPNRMLIAAATSAFYVSRGLQEDTVRDADG